MQVEDIESAEITPPLIKNMEQEDETEPVTQVQMNGRDAPEPRQIMMNGLDAPVPVEGIWEQDGEVQPPLHIDKDEEATGSQAGSPLPSNEDKQVTGSKPSSPLPSNEDQHAPTLPPDKDQQAVISQLSSPLPQNEDLHSNRPLRLDGENTNKAISLSDQEVIQPTSPGGQEVHHDDHTTGQPVSPNQERRQVSDSSIKENEANQNDAQEKFNRPPSKQGDSGETELSRPTSRSDTPVKVTRSIVQEDEADILKQDTTDRTSRPSSKTEHDVLLKTPSRERTLVDRIITPTDKAPAPVERAPTPVNRADEFSRQNSQGGNDKVENVRQPSNTGIGTTSRPHSQMNGHVQNNTDKIPYRRTPTPQNVSRPMSQANGVKEDISVLPLSRKGSATDRQSRPSSRTSQRLLPEVRQTTPVNLVTMGERQYSRQNSRGDELRQSLEYDRTSQRVSSTQAYDNKPVQLESVYVNRSRPTSRGSMHTTNQQRPPSKTSDNSNSSVLLGKISRPTSKASSHIDNGPQSLMRVTSPQQHHQQQQMMTLTFNGTSSITPRSGVNSITPRISAISTKCSMCQNSFTDPRLLPCLHSLCFGCLDAILESNKTQGEFSCPECDEKISALSPELLHNVYLQGILGVEATKSGEAHRCVVCSLRNKKSTATHQCLDCVDLLCDNCGNSHASTRATVEHLVVPLVDLATGEFDSEIRQRTKVKCRTHIEQPYEQFCTVCDTLICRECRLTEHSGHKHVSIEDAHRKNERKLLDMLQKAIEKQRRITGKERRIGKNAEEIDSMEDTLAKYIEKVTQEVINKLIQEKDFALLRLRKHMDKQRVDNLEQKTEVDMALKRLNAGIDFCNEVVKHGRTDEMLFLSPFIQKRLQHLLTSDLDTKHDIPVDFPSVGLRDEFRNVEDLCVFYFIPEDENSPSKLALLPGKPSASLTLLDRINILAPRDFMPPKINGLACTGDGHIVVGDGGNVNVKLFSSKGHYKDTLVNSKCIALAACNNIVAISDRFSIILISTDKKFRRRIPLENSGTINALTSLQGNYFVVYIPLSQLFKVYSMDGAFVRDFPMAKPRRRGMQRNPKYIATNNQGHLIFSDWGSNSVVHMNDKGEVLNEYRCGNIGRYNNGWNPGGLSVDSYDNVLITDPQNVEILILNKDLRIIYKRKMRKDNLDKPQLVVGDNCGHNFYVAGKGGTLNEYAIKYA